MKPAAILRDCDALFQSINQSLICVRPMLHIKEEEKKIMKSKKRSERRKHCARAGCSTVRTPPARCKHTNTQTGPITIHCAAVSQRAV